MLLDSSIGDSRQFACDGELVTFTCQVFLSDNLEWNSPLIDPPIRFASTDMLQSVRREPFVATLTSVVGTTLAANFTATLQVNASRMILPPNTTVECNSEESDFTTAG